MSDRLVEKIINKEPVIQRNRRGGVHSFSNTPLGIERAELHQQLMMQHPREATISVNRNPIQNNSTQEASSNGSFFSSAWNAITHNAISGGLEFMGDLSATQRGITPMMSELSSALTLPQRVALLPQRVASLGARGANRLASIPRVSSMSQAASKVLAPLGVVSNGMALYESLTGSGNSSDDNGLQRGTDSVFNLAGLLSAGIGTAATFAGEGTAISAAAGVATPAAAVLGAAAGGYALGQFADEHLGISDGISDGMVAVDNVATSALRWAGAYDESRPAYTQTLGYRLGEVLPSWMQ